MSHDFTEDQAYLNLAPEQCEQNILSRLIILSKRIFKLGQ